MRQTPSVRWARGCNCNDTPSSPTAEAAAPTATIPWAAHDRSRSLKLLAVRYAARKPSTDVPNGRNPAGLDSINARTNHHPARAPIARVTACPCRSRFLRRAMTATGTDTTATPNASSG